MVYHINMSSWAQIAKHEEPDVSAKKNKTYPLGWVRIYRDEKNHVAFEHHENDPYLQEKEVDLNELMGKAILRMRARWEYHHYLSGTYYNYDIQDDLDDYGSDVEDYEDSDSDQEQNTHLVGGGHYTEE